jgi:hypothetical protein
MRESDINAVRTALVGKKGHAKVIEIFAFESEMSSGMRTTHSYHWTEDGAEKAKARSSGLDSPKVSPRLAVSFGEDESILLLAFNQEDHVSEEGMPIIMCL